MNQDALGGLAEAVGLRVRWDGVGDGVPVTVWDAVPVRLAEALQLHVQVRAEQVGDVEPVGLGVAVRVTDTLLEAEGRVGLGEGL